MCALAGRGATARARNSARSPVVNPLQHGAGGVVHHDVAPRQYPPRDLEEPVPAHAGAARATPGEWGDVLGRPHVVEDVRDRKSTRLNSSHSQISYAVFCLKKKKNTKNCPLLSKHLTRSTHSDVI